MTCSRLGSGLSRRDNGYKPVASTAQPPVNAQEKIICPGRGGGNLG